MGPRCLLLSVILVVGILPPAVAPARPPATAVVRLTNGEWPPWMSRDLPGGGPVSRLVEEAWQQEGVTVQWGWMPWARGYALAAAGQWDGTTGWIRTPERERRFLYSNPLFFGETVLFFRRDRPVTWSTPEDLRPLRIGVTLSYSYGVTFDRLIQAGRLDVDPAPDDVTNLKKLIAGRIDAFPLERHVGWALIREHFADDAHRLGCSRHPVKKSSYHLLISRVRPGAGELVRTFDRGLQQLRDSGRADQILLEVRKGTPECTF